MSSTTPPRADERRHERRARRRVEHAACTNCRRRRPAIGAGDNEPDEHRREPARAGSRAAAPRTIARIRAGRSQHREDRAELDGDVEDARRGRSNAQPKNARARIRCAVDETGRNSVSPWTTPSRAAADERHTARLRTLGLGAGGSRRGGALPRPRPAGAPAGGPRGSG